MSTNERTPLLHNIGWAPQAHIHWAGLGGKVQGSRAKALARAGATGTWLRLRCSIASTHEHAQRHWHSASALLRMLETETRGTERRCERRLAELIEQHTAALRWPPYLLMDSQPKGQMLCLDHPLTTFVVLSKSTGRIWIRDREPRLSALMSPLFTDERLHIWQCAVWFATGLPADLLKDVRQPSTASET